MQLLKRVAFQELAQIRLSLDLLSLGTQRLLKMLLCLAVLLLPWTASSVEENPSRQKLEDVQQKIEETTRKALEYEKQAASLEREIADLSRQLVKTAHILQETESRLNEREARLVLLDQKQDQLETRLKTRSGQMAETLAALQRLSQQPPELVAFRPDEAINSLRSASLLRRILPTLRDKARRLREDMDELQNVRQEISLEREELRQELASLTVTREELDGLMAERKKRQQILHKATREERKKLAKFAATAKTLQELIARIEKENRAREEAARAAAQRLKDKPNRQSARSTAPETRLPGGGDKFALAKGTLPLPARGAIAIRFGQKTPEGHVSRGITILTRPEAMVVAPHDGRVIFAGKFRTYGQILIISHGDGYHTLLAGMTRLDAVVGQWILKGEPVGQMAVTDLAASNGVGNYGRKLYIELRQQGKPINPLPWIAARDRKVLG